jgi:hypothetical protein
MSRWIVAWALPVVVGCSSAATTAPWEESTTDAGGASTPASRDAAPATDAAPLPAEAAAAPGAEAAAECVYPSGPYGQQVGDVVDPSMAWQGYAPGASAPSTVHASDFYDCDGSKGIRAVLFDESAMWCGACVDQATEVSQLTGTFSQEGIAYVTLVYQDASEQPATTATALAWQQDYDLGQTFTVADPADSLTTFGIDPSSGEVNGFPTDVVVDPRTMTIVAVQPDDAVGSVTALAQQNGAP